MENTYLQRQLQLPLQHQRARLLSSKVLHLRFTNAYPSLFILCCRMILWNMTSCNHFWGTDETAILMATNSVNRSKLPQQPSDNCQEHCFMHVLCLEYTERGRETSRTDREKLFGLDDPIYSYLQHPSASVGSHCAIRSSRCRQTCLKMISLVTRTLRIPNADTWSQISMGSDL